MLLTKGYYTIKFLVPRPLQILLRRYSIQRRLFKYKHIWPIDKNACITPEDWSGWPDGKKFALILTHDVETTKGLEKCYQLAEIDELMGFRSSFNFVVSDYEVSTVLRQHLTDRGFEVGIHGVHHNNNPFRSESIFRKHAITVNNYLKEWGSVGFRSPSMFHDLELLHHLDIEYDASTFDTDPFEPQPDGMGTIFPLWVSGNASQRGYIELPYTLPQDFLLFILLQEKSIDTWKKKLDWIVNHGGMALLVAHPDYMNFGKSSRHDKYPIKYYKEFLEYIKSKYEGKYWNALPKDVARFWVSNFKIKNFKDNLLPRKLMSHHSSHNQELSSESRAIIIDPINDRRWDQFVVSHPFGLICHLSSWKKVLEESFPHMKGYYLVLLDHSNDSIRAALPVFEVKSILTGKRLVSIPFATSCDPLISSNEDMRELLNAVINLSTEIGCSHVEIRTLASWPLIHDSRIGRVVFNKTHQLSLETGPEELMATFSKQVKRKIKKFKANGLQFNIASDETELFEFYHLYVKTRKRLGLPPQPYLFFKMLWQYFSVNKHITLLLLRYEGQLIAGLIMFKFKERCSWEYLASDEHFHNLHINYSILWEAINLACSEGYKLFDFGRTGVNNEGLMNFKNLWGTRVADLPQFYYPRKLCSSLNYREGSAPYKIVKRISKNVPDFVFEFMGNFLYRHLG
jgi:peptidoglycan/xylan/chitin deacetylase (PgdA/CDA1 family)